MFGIGPNDNDNDNDNEALGNDSASGKVRARRQPAATAAFKAKMATRAASQI
jgi:hypothetical protein